MASTRNKNTPGNYRLEQYSLNQNIDWKLYEHSSCGRATQTNLPGNGILTGRMSNNELSNNACDIESYLRGIGSTNLVEQYSRFK